MLCLSVSELDELDLHPLHHVGSTSCVSLSAADGAEPPAAAAEPPAAEKPEWFHCDDSTVHRVPLSEVLRRQAYVLFYERLP